VQPTPLARASAGRESRRSALPDAHVGLLRLPAGRLTVTLGHHVSLDYIRKNGTIILISMLLINEYKK